MISHKGCETHAARNAGLAKAVAGQDEGGEARGGGQAQCVAAQQYRTAAAAA